MNKKIEEFLEKTTRIMLLLLEHPSIIWVILSAWLMYMILPLLLSGLIT
jgi:hypothetical protein